jgi:hypothetical protein
MKVTEFVARCENLLIAPEIVIENQSVRDALADKDDARVIELLETEF